MHRFRGPLQLLIATLLLLGCAEDTPMPGEPAGGPLDDVTLDQGSAISLARVYVEGLPSPRGDGSLRLLLLAGAAGEVEIPLDTDDGGTFFHAPVHPETPNQGGVARFVVEEGALRSPELPLDIEPLPAAPGAYAALVATLRDHVEQRAIWAGSSFAELQGLSFDEVSPLLFPLKLAQSTIDSPDESNDMTDLIANGGGLLNDEERELLDRYCGFTGFATLVQNEIDEFAAADDTLAAPFGGRGATSSGARGACIDTSPEISTANELSAAMILSALADLYTDPDGPGGEALGDIGLVVSGAGIIPGVGGGAAIVGVALGVLQSSGQYIGGMYPSAFASLDVDIDRTEFLEDDPGFARWENVRVVATSTGWSADGSIATLAITALGGVLSEVQRLQIFESNVLRDILVTGVNLGLGEFLEEFDDGIIDFCPGQWEIDITDLPFSTAQALNRRLLVDAATRQVRPKEAGEDFLRVAAQSSQFGGREVHEDLAMLVKTIIVDVTPDEILVDDPGEVVMITADIQHAELPTLLWDAAEGTWEDGIGDETNGPRTRPLKTPSSEAAYPFFVVVESLSRQGARASGEPPRLDFATIRYRPFNVIVSPQDVCVVHGEQETFTAVVEKSEDQRVTWTIEDPDTGAPSSDGFIDPMTGDYTAPASGVGEVLVVATSVANPDARGVSLISYGECVCFWSVAIDAGGRWTGDVATHQFPGQLPSWTLNLVHFDAGSVGVGSVQSIGGPVSEQVGTFEVLFTFIAKDRAWVAGPNQEKAFATLEVTENTGDRIDGVVSGIAVTVEGGEEAYRPFSVRFRSGEGVIGEPFCGDEWTVRSVRTNACAPRLRDLRARA